MKEFERCDMIVPKNFDDTPCEIQRHETDIQRREAKGKGWTVEMFTMRRVGLVTRMPREYCECLSTMDKDYNLQ